MSLFVNGLLLMWITQVVKLFLVDSMILSLITLELISITSYIVVLSCNSLGLNVMVLCVFLCFMVCESVLGLSIFISLTSVSGSTSMQSVGLTFN